MPDRDPLFVAVDAGTTGARAVAIDLDGRLVHESRRPYATTMPHPGWAEQNPDDWRDRALDALGDLVAAVGGARIAALGLTGQCPTVAPVGANFERVGPGLLYRDNRAAAEAEAMRSQFGIDAMHARTGHVAEAFHVGPKVLWMRANEPEAFAATDRFVQPRDVVLHALTGETATDETHANSTVFFDLNARAWASDYLDAFSLTPRLFPDVVPPWTAVGGISDSVASATGAPAGCPVVIGAADSQCAAFGSGVNSPGPISEMAGASSCLNSIVRAPLADLHVTHYSHVLPDCFCTELGINTTGAALTWAVDRLGFADYASLEDAARSVCHPLRRGALADPIAAAPLFLPFLGGGERDDVTLRAAFIGLDDRHTRAELAYAVVEGVALSVASVLDMLTSAGAPMTELRVAGGLARFGVLGALKADLLGVPVLHLDADTAPLGVALLAARSTGYRAEADAAVDSVVRRAITFEPSETGAEALRARRDWFFAIRGSDAVRLAPGR